MKKYFFSVLMLYFFITSQILAQEVDNEKKSVKRYDLLCKVKRDDLIDADKNKLLEKNFFKDWDSITTVSWKNYYWFVFQTADSQKNKDCYSLFAYNSTKKSIVKVIDRNFGFSSWYDFYSYFSFNNDKLYLCGGYKSDAEMGEIGIVVLDELNLSEQKYITVRKNAWFVSEYIKNGKLSIVVQPMKRTRNIDYFFFFWVPRSPPSKWNFEPVGNKRIYVYDKDFNLISEEEVKE